jgi:hypothetical protein
LSLFKRLLLLLLLLLPGLLSHITDLSKYPKQEREEQLQALAVSDFFGYEAELEGEKDSTHLVVKGLQESLRGIKEGSFLETIASLQTLEPSVIRLFCCV